MSAIPVAHDSEVMFYVKIDKGVRKQTDCEEVACKVALLAVAILVTVGFGYTCAKTHTSLKANPDHAFVNLALILASIVAAGCSAGALITCTRCFLREGRFALIKS